ncbi:MAG: sialate O-acetylesterase [Akkermansiaceae bacterium]
MMTRKQTQLLLQLTAAFLLVLGVQARTWTSADGTKTFKGELQSYDAKKGKVTVTLPNGKRQTFSQDRLSEPDITFAKENGRKASGSSSSGGDIKELPDELPDPDGKEADMSKPVQVYILMGQSNMLGAGRVSGGNEGALENACKNKKLYPYLIDDAGNWTARKDVRNVRVNGRTMKVHNNDWLTLKGANIGPEIGIGHYLGHAVTAPVLILKSCTGNRSLGWDLLPPGSKQYEFEGRIYAGYKESPESWAKGTAPKPIGWYAGLQYDDDIRNAKAVLADLKTYYPGATKYEVAGFFWWQGDKDFRNKAHASKYEENLIALLASLRKDFNAPEAKMVIATLGQTKKDAGGTHGQIINAMFNVAGESGKYPENKNKVATVYSHPLSKGGSSSGHYSGHAETYQNVGEAMGKAMVEMLQSK